MKRKVPQTIALVLSTGVLLVISATAALAQAVVPSPILPDNGALPSVSPDGLRIAFVSNRVGAKDLFVIGADGTGEMQLTHHVIDIRTGVDRRLGAHDQSWFDETPSWFPDGKRLAFQSNRTGRMEVWVMNADGSDQRQLTR